MASKFLSDEEFDVIQKMMESKRLPKFHIIAFNDTDMDVPHYQMASGFACYRDLFTFFEILKVVYQQVGTMCDIIEKGGEQDQEDVGDIEIVGKPVGNC